MKKAAVYTRTGDKGTTGLYTGERVSKCSPRVEAYGTLDEITSALGLARSLVKRDDVRETIFEVQKLMMSMMADVASLNLPQPYITEEHVKKFEETIDKYDAEPFPDPRRQPRRRGPRYGTHDDAPRRTAAAPPE